MSCNRSGHSFSDHIKKAYLRLPVPYSGGEPDDEFVPGPDDGPSWVSEKSRVKKDNVETVATMSNADAKRRTMGKPA
jgi:hypothetical protein